MTQGIAMGRVAAGAYIAELRKAQSWTRARLLSELKNFPGASDTETSESQILRIERGAQETRGTLLVALVRILKGNLDHLADLLLSDHATAGDGEHVAKAWLEDQRLKMQTASDATKQRSVFVYRRMAELLETGHSPQSALRIVESELEGGAPTDGQ